MDTFRLVVEIAGGLAVLGGVFTAIVAVIKKVLNNDGGIKCLLRNEILKIYNENKKDHILTYYERTNLEYLYQAYKARKGNSFVDDIYSTMREWEVLTIENEDRKLIPQKPAAARKSTSNSTRRTEK